VTKLETFPTGEGYGTGARNLLEVFQYFYHPDHLGSTSYATDRLGEIYQHFGYFPFGETWINEVTNDRRVPYRFTGKEFDEETKLYYFGARYYDPRTSVWQSPDPILGQYLSGSPNDGVANPKNVGLYTYTYQNPVRLTDLDGKNAGLCYSGHYKSLQCYNTVSGNWLVDNAVLGVGNQFLNAFVSAGNVVADPLIAIGTAIEPYSATIDGIVMSTPVPFDDAIKLVTGGARQAATFGRARLASGLSRAGPGTGVDLALGLGAHPGTDADLLGRFASNVGAKTYFDIFREGMPAGGFPQLQANLEKVMRNSKRIHFNIDQVDPAKYRAFLNRPHISEGITNWELQRVLGDPDLSAKATFYGRGGTVITNPRAYLGLD
jgi:RHS repeat-associated protein